MAGAEAEGTVFSLAEEAGADYVGNAVLSFLDAYDVGRCCTVSRYFQRMASAEEIWRPLRDGLWEGKVYVPERFRGMNPKLAFAQSLADSSRTHLTANELCSFTWGFRFKQQAGEAWMGQDPWWTGLPAPTVHFKPDHSVVRYGDIFVQPLTDITWQFAQGAARRTGPLGSFVRVRIAGRDVPTYVVSRHPTNWGFVMESCWTVYTSWKMPPKDGPESDPAVMDENLHITMNDQWEEAMAYNTGLTFIHELVDAVADELMGAQAANANANDGDADDNVPAHAAVAGAIHAAVHNAAHAAVHAAHAEAPAGGAPAGTGAAAAHVGAQVAAAHVAVHAAVQAAVHGAEAGAHAAAHGTAHAAAHAAALTAAGAAADAAAADAAAADAAAAGAGASAGSGIAGGQGEHGDPDGAH